MQSEEFRKIRDEIRMTQEKMARQLGISSQSVSRYERGREPIPKYIELAVKQLEAIQNPR